jgi:hypothetical protein
MQQEWTGVLAVPHISEDDRARGVSDEMEVALQPNLLDLILYE